MKTAKKLIAHALLACIGLSVAAPAHADWYDGRHHHHGRHPEGWVYDARLRYYVYQPAYVVAPPPVVVATPPQGVYAVPQPYYAQPVYEAPAGVNVGVHIR